MKFTSEFSRENISEFYVKNKDFIFPAVGIVASIFLFIFFLLPQVASFPSKKAESDQEALRLDRMQKAYDLLSTTDESQVDANLLTARKALPDKKDFESVLSAISLAASNTNTQIKGYSYSGGAVAAVKYPTLTFEIEAFGEIADAISFINEIYRTFPLSDVSSLVNSDGTSKFTVNFYYRPFPDVSLDERTMVTHMSQEQDGALKTISGWNDSFSEPSSGIIATPSGESNSPF